MISWKALLASKHQRQGRVEWRVFHLAVLWMLLQSLPEVGGSTNPNSPIENQYLVSPTGTASSETVGKPPKIKSKSPPALLSGTQSIFVRRIQREWRDAVRMGLAYDWLQGKPIGKSHQAGQQYVCLGPLGSNLFVWHFSFMAVENSTYDGGIYHGRLVLPPHYPSSPPRVQVWTPSGRYLPRADICLSASAFHPETWNPGAFNLRTIIESLRLHMLTPPTEIGGTSATPEKRASLAHQSRCWKQMVTVSSTKKGGPRVATIDHAKMIRQSVFPALDATDAEPEGETTASIQIAVDKMDPPPTLKKRRKTKQRRKKPQEDVEIMESMSLISWTINAVLNNRHLRMVLLAVCLFLVLFGN